MTFEAFWASILPNNPDLANDQTILKMRVNSFREAMAGAYAAGSAHGMAKSETGFIPPDVRKNSLFVQEFGESMSQAKP